MKGFTCIACGTSQNADFAGFLCPDCGGNLDISYDYDAIIDDIERSGIDRARSIFTYAAFLPVARPAERFPLRIGRTPLYEAKRLGATLGLRNLYLKDDTSNPSASSATLSDAIMRSGPCSVLRDPSTSGRIPCGSRKATSPNPMIIATTAYPPEQRR